MSWTVACFCGNTYTSPPNRCQVCGSSVDELDAPNIRGRIAEHPTAADAHDAYKDQTRSGAHVDPVRRSTAYERYRSVSSPSALAARADPRRSA
jgi:hypothetical protein